MAQEEQAVRSTGKVSWFSDGKGYGFITPDDGGEELLVHQSSILADGFRSLNVGESVEFVIAQGNGGKTKAVDVTAPGGGPFKKQDKNSDGRRFGAGDSGCYKCGEVGHLARECDNSGVEKGRDEGCFQCGELGHFARDCRKNSSEISGGGGGGSCYTCGGYGHMARNCTSRRPTGAGRGGACHECGETGHFARDCERRGGGGGGSNKCFSCGKLGHFARECGFVS